MKGKIVQYGWKEIWRERSCSFPSVVRENFKLLFFFFLHHVKLQTSVIFQFSCSMQIAKDAGGFPLTYFNFIWNY